MIKFLIFSLFVALNVLAETSWKTQVQNLLPPPLSQLQPQKTTLTEIEKLLGKAHLVEGKDYYWERDGLKYALKLSVNEKKILTTLHYTFTSEKPALDKLKTKIPVSKMRPYPTHGKAAGRFLLYKENNAELIIDPVSKTIHSVQLP